MVHHNVVNHSHFDAIQKTIHGSYSRKGDLDLQPDTVWDSSGSSLDVTMVSPSTGAPLGSPSAGAPLPPIAIGKNQLDASAGDTPSRPVSIKKVTLASCGTSEDAIITKTQPKAVELINGYGNYLTQRQLDAAVDVAGNSPTKLMRNLLAVFFTPETLATSSALGTKVHAALDVDTLGACIRFVQQKFQHVSRSVLIDCTNDKCANYRRKRVKVKQSIALQV